MFRTTMFLLVTVTAVGLLSAAAMAGDAITETRRTVTVTRTIKTPTSRTTVTTTTTTVTPPATPASQPAALRATGRGKPPRGKSPAVARLMARRAAEVVAVRNLARKLSPAPRPDARTRTTHTSATIAGFRYLPPVYHPDGAVSVTVELRRPVMRPAR